jgi:hypothetical protein
MNDNAEGRATLTRLGRAVRTAHSTTGPAELQHRLA